MKTNHALNEIEDEIGFLKYKMNRLRAGSPCLERLKSIYKKLLITKFILEYKSVDFCYI
jgi:hypothetical protein